MGDSPDLAAAKQLMHGAKAEGFRFERIAEGPDAPVVGVRDSVGYRDEIYLAGFSDSCTAIRHKRFSLIVPGRPPVVSHRPDSTLMTTAAAAHHLGLAGRDSARIWLAQRGIRPVGREPGPSGQNLYPPRP